MKPKKLISKLGAVVLSMLMILTNVDFAVFARTAHVTLGEHLGYSYDVVGPDGHSEWNANNNYIYVDGKLGFCIQPGHILVPGNANQVNYSQLGVLGKIAYVGYWDTAQTKADYMATQLYMWEYMGGTIRSTSLSDYSSRKANIKKKLNKLNIRPSFHGKSYEMNVGETLRITDTNGVLSDCIIMNKGNADVSIVGNDLVIKANGNTDDIAKILLQKVPKNFVGTPLAFSNGSQDVALLPMDDPISTRVSVTVKKYGSLKIAKQDEDGKYVPNTSFKLSYNADMSKPIGTYKTGADGTVTVPNLLPKTVYVQEVDVPDHLVLDSTIHSVTIEANKTATYNARNNWVKGKVMLKKVDADTNKQVGGATYAIYNAQGQEVERLVTKASGYVESGYLRFGNYTVKEVIAPNGYILNDTVYPITISSNEQKIEVTGHDERQRGRIEITKEDSVTGNQAQGEGTLEGAVYGLYAREDIVDPADQSVIYKAGKKVKELTIDENGHATTKDDLYLGRYFIKEIKASNGYTLDPTEYDIDLAYAGQNVEVATKQQTVKERVIAQAFSIIKISSNETDTPDFLEGAEFTVKSQKDIDKYGSWEAAPIAKNAKGEEAAILVTDKKGYAVSDELPYGTYVVRETKTPNEHYAVADFKVVVSEDSREPQAWKVLDDKEFKAVVSIVKQDADTGKTVAIAGAKFKIKNLATNEYVGYWDWNPLPHYVNEWTTDESGTVMTGETLTYGEYQIEEVKAPNGYLLSEKPIKFTISKNDPYQTLPDGKTPVITVVQKDTAVKGRINVEKRGEVLVGFDNGNFVYEERGLKGMTAKVYAEENIMDPSNDGTILYKKGTLVDTITTGENGKATTKKLPLGVYEVREVTAPNGMVINTKPQTVELKYKDQDTAIVYEDITFHNERQKVKASLVKVDEDGTTGLSGAEFNLIAKEDIKNADGKVIVKANTVLKKYTSDADGNIRIDLDLPLNTDFALKEVKAPVGYVLDQTEILFNTNYQGQDVQTIVIEKIKENERTKVSFSKTDATTGKELAGNHLTIFEKENPASIFTSWVSGEKPHVVENLSTDTRYVLRETSAVKGFYLATDIEFEIAKDGTVYTFDKDGNKVVAKDNLIKMENNIVTGRLKWNKSGEIFTSTISGQTEFGKTEEPVWETANLLGAEITIYAAEDITLGNGVTYYKKDEAIQTLESDLESVQSKDLLVGKYYYVESKVPHGYLVDTDKHYFEIKDNQSSEIQIVDSTLNNNRPTIEVEFTKFMEQYQHHDKLDNAYKDVVFGIFAREDIYSYKGEVAIENGTMISTTGIDELGQLEYVPDLPNGVYYLKELQTNPDYVLDTNEYDFEVAYHGQDVSSYKIVIGEDGTIENKLIRGSIQIMKKDSFDENKVLTGVPFNISANADMSEVITTVETDGNGIATFKDMELGKYYIQEAEQVGGYAINDHIYEVEITTNGELLTIEVDNKPTEITFEKVDETGKLLAGAKMQVVSLKTKDIIDEWTSTGDAHVSKYLVEGEKYILREVEAPYGYALAEDIEFTAKDGGYVVMENQPIIAKVQVNKVDSITKEVIKHKDFAFTAYADKECKQEIKSVHADVESGTATFDLRYGEYWIKETAAPKGYLLSDEVVEIVINDEGVFANGKKLTAENSIYSIIYFNTPLEDDSVHTGDNTSISGLAFLLFVSLGGLFLLKRKTKEEE